MGLLDSIESQLGVSQHPALLQAVNGLISNSGGLSGVINKFTQNGLGQHVQSWVSNAENIPVTGDHIRQVFGSGAIEEIAQKLGVDPAKASSLVAGVLPNVVDKLTPQGQVVPDAQAQQGLAGLLSKGLASLFAPKP